MGNDIQTFDLGSLFPAHISNSATLAHLKVQ